MGLLYGVIQVLNLCSIRHRTQGCGWGRRRFTLAPLRCATGFPALLGIEGTLRVDLCDGRWTRHGTNRSYACPLRGPTLDSCGARRQRGAPPAPPTALQPTGLVRHHWAPAMSLLGDHYKPLAMTLPAACRQFLPIGTVCADSMSARAIASPLQMPDIRLHAFA